MFVKIAAVISIFVVVAQIQAAPQSRIINGNIASRTQFPWHVSLHSFRSDNPTRYCGGSLIAANFVLTSASCIANATNIKVDVGITRFHYPTETQNSSMYRLHPNYDVKNRLNDIAIIKLDKNVTYRDNVMAITLPGRSQVNNTFIYQQTYFSGFGVHEKDKYVISADLRYNANVVISNEYCKQALNKEHVDLCAVSYESSVCFGDEGGALVINVAGKFAQIAVLSTLNPSGCDVGNAHVYSKVTNYLEWIAYLTGLEFNY